MVAFLPLFAAVAMPIDTTVDYINDRVAVSANGTAAIVCHTPPESGGRVFLAILDSADRLVAPPVEVNAGIRGTGQNADVGIDDSGAIMVVWEQLESNYSVSYVRKFGPDGAVLNAPKLVADGKFGALGPRIAVEQDGRSVVCWLDYRSGPALYAQRFGVDGSKLGTNVLVAKSRSLIQYPVVRCGIDGSLLFVWQDVDRRKFHIYASSADWNLSGPFIAIEIDRSGGTASASSPDAFLRTDGERDIVWKDYRTGEANIYIQMMSADRIVGENVKVNDDSGHQWQRLPMIGGASTGEFLCVWEDYRHDRSNQIGDVYGQRYDAEGSAVGQNFMVNGGPEHAIQEFPALAVNGDGTCIVTWNDARNKRIQVYMKRFSIAKPERGMERPVF